MWELCLHIQEFQGENALVRTYFMHVWILFHKRVMLQTIFVGNFHSPYFTLSLYFIGLMLHTKPLQGWEGFAIMLLQKMQMLKQSTSRLAANLRLFLWQKRRSTSAMKSVTITARQTQRLGHFFHFCHQHQVSDIYIQYQIFLNFIEWFNQNFDVYILIVNMKGVPKREMKPMTKGMEQSILYCQPQMNFVRKRRRLRST